MQKENFFIISYNLFKYRSIKKYNRVAYNTLRFLKKFSKNKLLFNEWSDIYRERRAFNLKIKKINKIQKKKIRRKLYRINYYVRMWMWLAHRDRNIGRNTYLKLKAIKKKIIYDWFMRSKFFIKLCIAAMLLIKKCLLLCLKDRNFHMFFLILMQVVKNLIRIICKKIILSIAYYVVERVDLWYEMQAEIDIWYQNRGKNLPEWERLLDLIFTFYITYLKNLLPLKKIRFVIWFLTEWSFFDITAYTGPYTKHSFFNNTKKNPNNKNRLKYKRKIPKNYLYIFL